MSLCPLPVARRQTEQARGVYGENLALRDRVHAAEAELAGLRTLAHDYNNLSARVGPGTGDSGFATHLTWSYCNHNHKIFIVILP